MSEARLETLSTTRLPIGCPSIQTEWSLSRSTSFQALVVSVPRLPAPSGCEVYVEGDVPNTREPSTEELLLIREVLDPRKLREREVPSA